MKLVIDAVTTPLLHAKLSEARTPRERAALLRSIAESALRFHHAEPFTPAPQNAGVATVVTGTKSDTALPLHLTASDEMRTNPTNEGDAARYDSAGIADQFSAFF